MNQHYRTFRPLQGVQIVQGAAQPVVLAAGNWIQVVRHSRQWPSAVDILYRGIKVIVFFEDLCDCAMMQRRAESFSDVVC